MKEKKFDKRFLDSLFEGRLLRIKGQPTFVRDKARLIMEEVTKEFNLSHPIELYTNSREELYVVPRRIAVNILREELGLPYTTLSRMFGYKNHTGAIHADKVVKEVLQDSPAMSMVVEKILERVEEATPDADDHSSNL